MPEHKGDEGRVEPRPKTSSSRAVAIPDPLGAYRRQLQRSPPLSREEEHELAVRFHAEGDLDAARRLVIANLRLVVKIAYEYRQSHPNLLDLIQEGNLGLVQAVTRFDPERGVKLSSYAAWWIRAYILKFILDNWRMVRIGGTRVERKLFYNLRKEQRRLESMGFEPEAHLLAERLEVPEADVVEMTRRMSAPDLSLDQPVGHDEDDAGASRLDLLAGQEEMRPDVAAEASELRELLHEKLARFAEHLSGRDRILFEERLLSESPVTLQGLGERFGVSRERVRQLEKRLLDRLRHYLESELGGAVEIGSLEL